jgi:hypothetical protein
MSKERKQARNDHYLRLIFVQDLKSGASRIHVDGGVIKLTPGEFIAAHKLEEGDRLQLSRGEEISKDPYYFRRLSDYQTKITVIRGEKKVFAFTLSNDRISQNLLKRTIV